MKFFTKSPKRLEDYFFSSKVAQEHLQKFCRSKYLQRDRGSFAATDASYLDFVFQADRAVPRALRQIKSKSYALAPASPVKCFLDKERVVFRFNWLDSFLLYHLAESLMRILAPQLPSSLHSYRSGRGVQSALAAWKRWKIAQPALGLYLFRGDIQDFGESLPHEALLNKIDSLFKPTSEIRGLIEQILRHPWIDDKTLKYRTKGAPTGHYIQLVFENILLRDFDMKMQSVPDLLYLRYGDDILLASKSSQQRDLAQDLFNREIQSLGLKAHPEKCQSFSLVPPHHANAQKAQISHFRYLGRNLFWNGMLRWPRDKMSQMRKQFERDLLLAMRLIEERPLRERHTLLSAHLNQMLSGPLQERLSMFKQEDRQGFKEFSQWAHQKYYQAQLGGGFNRGLFRKAKQNKINWEWARG